MRQRSNFFQKKPGSQLRCNMILKSFVFLIVLFQFVIMGGATDKPCLEYEPKTVTLEGYIKIITYPGPPNYESIKNGDRPEKCAILFLKEPICVKADPKSNEYNEDEINQVRIQLVPSESVPGFSPYATHKKRKYYRLKGTLFHWITGHHRTPVLMTVNEITEIAGS